MTLNQSPEVLYQTYKPLLFSLAYRMLGSVMDAEDIVQEIFLYWSENKPSQVLNEKAYLCKMVTNRCMDRLRAASRQREVYVGPWLPEPLLTDVEDFDRPSGTYLHKESLSTAYLLLLQQLTWVERAVFILREVLQYEYDEIAEIVGKSSANCRQIFHRAKSGISGMKSPGDSKGTETSRSDSIKLQVDQFVQALISGNAAQLVSQMKSDAILYSDGGGKVTAAIRPILGAERISMFLFGLLSKLPADYSYRIVFYNDQPAIVSYFGKEPNNVMTFRIEDNVVSDIYIVVNPDKLQHLPRL